MKILNLKNEINLDNINDEILYDLTYYLGMNKLNHIKEISKNTKAKYKKLIYKKFIFGNYDIEMIFLGTFLIWEKNMCIFYLKKPVINNKHYVLLEEYEFKHYCTLKND